MKSMSFANLMKQDSRQRDVDADGRVLRSHNRRVDIHFCSCVVAKYLVVSFRVVLLPRYGTSLFGSDTTRSMGV
ncbi:hypothetical protein PTSG_09939 [Salpingoeca rosetta]|uniref:Uncharacterized protein n=1 Tax=Salpingoeca rosetta (strain ATCC 50818 / BSB-021) TaxID=946362 RepID=F2UNL2_SALR5|nr:uncharacterized protein PTSG_09939 [Salpingoeca rosetta]EGD79217.1 hypothetical protein PTSG_09939 [Salpingoeca rosetta]|eukprot:XP_004989302.1 hypothetical protein PTSG_09939 [Salpingoeca rosetta]